MTEILKFEIVRANDDFSEIVFKSPNDLAQFYDGVVINAKSVILIWTSDNVRKSRLLQNDDIVNKITDRKITLISEELI